MKFYALIGLVTLTFFTSCSTGDDNPVTLITNPAGPRSELPFLATDQAGNVFLSWILKDTTGTSAKLRYAELNGTNWSSPRTLAASDEWFLNWADYPTIVAENDRVTTAHTLRKVAGGTYSYNVNIYRSIGVNSWSEPITPHFDSTATEHGFVSMVPWKNKILAVWLDGRRSENRTDEEYFDITRAMTLRSALIGNDGIISSPKRIDKSVCDCCNTSLALTNEGPIVAYRNRTDDEVRDIFVSRLINGEWSVPQPVANDGWDIASCPVNGPAIAASDSTVVVAWYTAANRKTQVKAALSSDNGKTFSNPVVINEKKPLGRVDAVISNDGSAYISWIEQSQQQTVVKIRALSQDTSLSAPLIIAPINPDRQSGFPQMELSKGNLIFAWTEVDSLNSSIRTARLAVSEL